MEITRQQIEQLKAEAGGAGDSEMVAICRIALGADRSDATPGSELARALDEGWTEQDAWERCEEVAAEAQAEHHA